MSDQEKTGKNESKSGDLYSAFIKAVDEFNKDVNCLGLHKSFCKELYKDMLIDRNPPLETVDNFITGVIDRIKLESKLICIYGGYNLIQVPAPDSSDTIGKTSLVGMNLDEMNSIISDHDCYLCYIAIPIDRDDDLIERPSMSDWEFENEYIADIIRCNLTCIGAINYKNYDVKLRTIKFFAKDKKSRENGLIGRNELHHDNDFLDREVARAVDLKRRGEFEEAMSIYNNLQSSFPKHAGIYKSMAKVLVCLGRYDDAIQRLNSAKELFHEARNEGEVWQCQQQLSVISNRNLMKTEFIDYVRAISANSNFIPRNFAI